MTGNEKLPEWGVGMYDFNARMYDAGIGRFMAIDPKADDEQESWNPYHYTYNNPTRYTDPTGLKTKGECDGDEDCIEDVEQEEERRADMYASNNDKEGKMWSDYYKSLADEKWAARTGVDFSALEVPDDQSSGGVDLSNTNQKDLFNAITQGMYKGHRDGKTMSEVFDFSNVEVSAYFQWRKTLSFKDADGKIIIIDVLLTKSLRNSNTQLPINHKAPYNAKGTESPRGYVTKDRNRKLITYLFLYKFKTDDGGTGKSSDSTIQFS
ncbi:MAG: RHS repeat-associated core domain-containing protein [Bacteroidota bacterium]